MYSESVKTQVEPDVARRYNRAGGQCVLHGSCVGQREAKVEIVLALMYGVNT
jgi:hypothetical protein